MCKNLLFNKTRNVGTCIKKVINFAIDLGDTKIDLKKKL